MSIYQNRKQFQNGLLVKDNHSDSQCLRSHFDFEMTDKLVPKTIGFIHKSMGIVKPYEKSSFCNPKVDNLLS
jgi:hypothetical protein